MILYDIVRPKLARNRGPEPPRSRLPDESESKYHAGAESEVKKTSCVAQK